MCVCARVCTHTRRKTEGYIERIKQDFTKRKTEGDIEKIKQDFENLDEEYMRILYLIFATVLEVCNYVKIKTNKNVSSSHLPSAFPF